MDSYLEFSAISVLQVQISSNIIARDTDDSKTEEQILWILCITQQS